ncbi:MAG: ABC transporter ATP-binding protein [Candidatus Heimdallarchaeota archaeon]
MTDNKNNSNIENKLQAIEITKIFPHPVKKETNIAIFAGASFEMSAGNLNFIIGPSGSGKTTLLRMLMGIEPLSAGEVFLNGQAIHTLKGKEKIDYFKSVGYMDQFPARYLSLSLSARRNLTYSLRLYRKTGREEEKKQVEEIATTLNLESLLNQKTLSLSGGELRRLALACSMIHNPSLLLLDEPTAQLDAENKETILTLLKKLNETIRSLIIISTHDMTIIEPATTFKIEGRRVIKWK